MSITAVRGIQKYSSTTTGGCAQPWPMCEHPICGRRCYTRCAPAVRCLRKPIAVRSLPSWAVECSCWRSGLYTVSCPDFLPIRLPVNITVPGSCTCLSTWRSRKCVSYHLEARSHESWYLLGRCLAASSSCYLFSPWHAICGEEKIHLEDPRSRRRLWACKAYESVSCVEDACVEGGSTPISR